MSKLSLNLIVGIDLYTYDMDESVQILELAGNAQRLFENQEPRQKRRLLNFLLSNCSWEDGEVVATFRQPFDLLAETTAIAATRKATNGVFGNNRDLAPRPGLEPGTCGLTGAISSCF
jgi:hypothetical protein